MSLPPLPLLIACALAVASVAAAPHDCHATAFIATMYRDRNGADRSVRSESGAFADGYASSALGELIHVLAADGRDDFGCSRPWRETTVKSWVALVRRGGCSIETKIENALNGNASAVVVYNNRDSLNLVKMRVSKKFQGLISVVFTYKWKGDELAVLLDSGNKVVVDLSIANPCVIDSTDYDRNMQLMSVSFLCFIVLTISTAWLVFYYIQRYRDIQVRERKLHGYSEADEKALKAIPTKIVKSNDKLLQDESECCAICIDPYKTEEVVRTLMCGHEFHRSCIDPWLLENRTCPMCKKDILRQYGAVFTGSQESILQVMADEATRLAGPSSSEIQIVIVGDLSAPSSPLRGEMSAERVQPDNADSGQIAGSSASLWTLDSAKEAVSLEADVGSSASLMAVDSAREAADLSDDVGSSASLMTVDSAQEATSEHFSNDNTEADDVDDNSGPELDS